MNIYVGNLSYNTTDASLREAFEQYGTVDQAKVVFDKMTNRSRGFGFVEMPDDHEGRTAIDAMNGANLDGRSLKVNEARPRPEGGRGGGGGDRRPPRRDSRY